MSRKTVEKYKALKQKSKTPVITPAEHRANCEIVADMLMEVFDRLPKNSPPVKESFGELLAQMDKITGRNETIIQTADGRRLRVDNTGKISVIQNPARVPASNTKTDSDSAKLPESDTGTFTPEEFKNG